MKKLVAVLMLGLVLVFSLTGCGIGTESVNKTQDKLFEIYESMLGKFYELYEQQVAKINEQYEQQTADMMEQYNQRSEEMDENFKKETDEMLEIFKNASEQMKEDTSSNKTTNEGLVECYQGFYDYCVAIGDTEKAEYYASLIDSLSSGNE